MYNEKGSFQKNMLADAVSTNPTPDSPLLPTGLPGYKHSASTHYFDPYQPIQPIMLKFLLRLEQTGILGSLNTVVEKRLHIPKLNSKPLNEMVIIVADPFLSRENAWEILCDIIKCIDFE